MSLRDQVLSALSLKSEPATLPGGVAVRVHEMTLAEYMQWQGKAFVEGKAVDDYHGLLVAYTVRGDDGARVLTDEDAAALQKASPDALLALVATAKRLNGIGQKAAEDAEKN